MEPPDAAQEGQPSLFLSAERAAQSALDLVIDRAAEELYRLHIERKAYPFATDVLCEYFTASMAMAFVPYDEGEPSDEGWTIEPVPERPPIDTWARSCVPVRAKVPVERGKSPAPKPTKPDARRKTIGSVADVQIQPKSWSLAQEQTFDEDEEQMRTIKAQEDRKRRDEEDRAQRKVRDEEEEKARLHKARSDMDSKPFTFDSEGRVLWVQPPQTERLPPPVTLPSYKFRRDDVPPPRKPPGHPPRGRAKKPVKAEYTDLFTKLATCQPPLLDVIELAPGVRATEKGRTRDGAEVEAQGAGKLSRKAYQELTESGGGMATLHIEETPRDEPVEPVARPQPTEVPSPGHVPTLDDFNQAILHSPGWGENPERGQPNAQAAAPMATWDPRKQMQMKRDAIGNLGKVPRDRLAPLGTTGRFKAPQPPLGAVMGHGFMGQESEYYYPGKPLEESVTQSPKTSLPPGPVYDAETIGRALDLKQQRMQGGGVVRARDNLLRNLLT